jgi:HEAT repeat protein
MPILPPKISTILIGVILLLPFAVTFLKMILKDGPDPSTRAEFERMSKEMRADMEQVGSRNGNIMRSIAIYEGVTIHPSLALVWQLSPRRWVGVVGLALVVCLLAIFIFSATNFKPAFSDFYANVPDEASSETDLAVPADRLSQLLAQIDNTDNIDRSVEARQLLEEEAQMNWLPRLRQILEAPGDFYIRESVAPAVIRLEGMAALPRLIVALRLGFDEGMDCDSLQFDVTRLIESDPPAAVRLLLPMADSSDPGDRADAAWLLGYVHAEVPPEIFIRLAKDDIPEVRRAACGSLASLEGYEPAFQMLISCLEDTDENVRISAISSLGSFGDKRALPLLERLVIRSSKSVRPIVVHAISSLTNR